MTSAILHAMRNSFTKLELSKRNQSGVSSQRMTNKQTDRQTAAHNGTPAG